MENSESPVLASVPTCKAIACNVAKELDYLLQNSEFSMLPCAGIDGSVQSKIEKSLQNGKQNVLSLDFGGSTIKYAVVQERSLEILHKFESAVARKHVDYRFFEEITAQIVKDLSGIRDLFKAQECIPVVISFSFPMDSNYRIRSMGKCYYLAQDVKESNLISIFERCFSQIETTGFPSFRVRSIVNDSVAVHLYNLTQICQSNISIVLGTGINACFQLHENRLPSWKRTNDRQGYYFINSEIGFLGGEYLPLSCYDYGYNHRPEPFMPCEFLTSGKWISFSLTQFLKRNKVHAVPNVEWDGEQICQVLEGKVFASEEVKSIIKHFIQRAANVVCGLIFGIDRFLRGKEYSTDDCEIHIGYVGTFLNKCHYYREQITILSEHKIHLYFLKDSSLIGPVISLYG